MEPSRSRKQLFKIIVLGDAGVGKTALLNRYVNEKFTQNYRATVGADFMSKDLFVNQRNITLQIWDTAGQERFQSLGGSFYRGADACILVYDITEADSFNQLDSWKENFLKAVEPSEPESFPFIVAANKCDLDQNRQIEREKAEEWCKNNHDAPLFEVSAKENTQITDLFIKIGQLVSAVSEEEEMYTVQTVKIDQVGEQKKSGCPC